MPHPPPKLQAVCCFLRLVIALAGACLFAGGLRGDELRVTWENGRLTAGNSSICQRWRLVGKKLIAESLQVDGYEWLCATADAQARVSSSPDLDIDWKTEQGAERPVEASSTRGILTLRDREGGSGYRFTVKVFEDCPAIVCRWQPLNAGSRSVAPAEVTLAEWNLAPFEINATSVEFADATDIHDNLVRERTWRLSTKERIELRTNLCTLQMPGQGSGIGVLKLEALPHARDQAGGPDFQADYRMFRIFAYDAGDIDAFSEWAVFGYNAGKWGRTESLQALQERLRPFDAARDGVMLSNTWGDRNRDSRIADAFIKEEIKADSQLGIDVCQIDDGWQKGISANSVKAGKNSAWAGGFYRMDPDFWRANPERFPRGLESIVEEGRKAGVKIGLWFSPDGEEEYKNWEKDRDRLVALFKQWSVTNVKIDGLQLTSNLSRARLRRLINEVLVETQGKMVFDLDITAGIRPGYFGLIECGPLFLENRYTDTHTWWPHATLRNLWQLAWYIPPQRFRIEFLNQERNAPLYAGDPLAPASYPADYGCAVSLVANPLAWCEVSRLPVDQKSALQSLISVWRQNRAELHSGRILPIGAPPDGAAWTGFCSVAPSGGACQALIFREDTSSNASEIELPISNRNWSIEKLAGEGAASIVSNRLTVRIDNPKRFLWVRLIPKALVVGIAGDSTVASYPADSKQQGWGRYLQEDFSAGVTVVNLAKGGRSTKTFLKEGLWDTLIGVRPNILLIQFGHNDSHEPNLPEHTDAQSEYSDLLRRFVREARAADAEPILITPVQRRTAVDSLRPYAAAMREVAVEERVKLIDLYQMSGDLYARLAPEEVAKLERPGDRTHFSARGAKVIEALVLEKLVELLPELKLQISPRSALAPHL
jgi:alpha-galactosidase